MTFSPRNFGITCVLGVLIALGAAGPCFAGWMGFRNDTSETIIVQETILVNGQAKPGRPQRLFAGEVVRDAQCINGQRTISIFDPKKPNQPIFNGNLACPATNENVLYVLKSDGKGGITIESVKTPNTPAPSPKK